MKKQLAGSLVATAALIAIAGAAQAAPLELNIYGASAQYLYWNAQAAHYANTRLGCPTANITQFSTPDGKHGLTRATGCTSNLIPAVNSGAVDIRYSGIASTEGILAVNKKAPLDSNLVKNITGYTGTTPSYGTTTCPNDSRAMADSASTASCHKVNVGTSDVAGDSLVQSSSGQKLGPNGGGTFTVSLTGVDTTGLTPANTVVVPFGFFVNSAVKAQTCTAGLIGNYCADATNGSVATTGNSQCDTVPGKGDGICGAADTITNISREEATLLFSGYVGNWKDLGDYFVDLPAVVCLRHAGSGTHSALDLTVMNSGWGNNIANAETAGSIWFNQGSGDEIKCINGNTPSTTSGSLIGAIGYADGDQAVNKDKNGVNVANAQNVRQLKYNGFYPTRTAIRNGLYDFYSNAWLYTNSTNGATINNLTNDLIAYASEPANVPSTKANYWAAVGEMKYNRGADASYPIFSGAGIPMLP